MVEIHTDDITVNLCLKCCKAIENKENCGHIINNKWIQHEIQKMTLTECLNRISIKLDGE